MNNSGSDVCQVIDDKKKLKNLVVVYDDMDLPLGSLKISFNRSSGGHNGLESIIKKVKSQEFIRIRVGVSPRTPTGKMKKPKGEEAILKFLLGKYKEDELKEVKKISKKISKSLDSKTKRLIKNTLIKKSRKTKRRKTKTKTKTNEVIKEVIKEVTAQEPLNYNQVLGREGIATAVAAALNDFQTKKMDLTIRRGIYIYGNPGVGKTEFVVRLLKSLNYDMVKYDAGDIRNKSIIDLITKHNMSEHSVLSMFQRKPRRIAIVMDEIDGMNNGDKGGINTLIKLMRPKKTKKQRLEDVTMNPIICIGNHHMDKKIRELMKVCVPFEIPMPTMDQVSVLLNSALHSHDVTLHKHVTRFIQGDLRKISIISGILNHMHTQAANDGNHNHNHNHNHNTLLIQTIFQPKANNEDSKTIVKKLINAPCKLMDHSALMNETDRTIVGLLWHENVVDALAKVPHQPDAFAFYKEALDNICFADYIDRITFQRQIWQFNEMSSLIKTFYNNKLYHDRFDPCPKFNPSEVRFTKVLTKYSTEYNNAIFIQMMCQKFGMDKKDLFAFFLHLFANKDDAQLEAIIEEYEITKLDIQRMQRYLDKCTHPSEVVYEDAGDEDGCWE
jgi:peptidyl-tRNA hydrolase